MQPQDLEPEMEEFLLRLVPDLAKTWEGATAEELAAIEQIAGRELPRFYRWFLARMGRSMGAIAYPRLDFSARRVLSTYEEGVLQPSPRFLMIGYETDIAMQLHLFYDFEHEARGDARVTKHQALPGPFYGQFDTFREMIAWGELGTHGVERCPCHCVGLLVDHDGDVLGRLRPVLESLGFTSPIATGPRCGLFEAEGMAMITSSSVGEEPKFHPFRLGGPSQARVRRVLGEITAETDLKLKVREWSQ